MKLAIMQPYFMPYIGYFSLIKHTDEFILFDTVQFIRHGWIERNRILKQNGGWQYVQIPIIRENGRDTLIKDVKINNSEDWKNKIFSQLQHYKKKAPFYWNTINLLKEIFRDDFHDIVTLNKKSLTLICDYIGIKREFPVFSKMNVNIAAVTAPDEWALNICHSLGACEYINPIGGISFFDRSKYEKLNIELKFQNMNITEYDQFSGGPFEPGLSILDVLMYNDIKSINQMLDDFSLI